jgi:hypothetical protein
MMTGRDPTRPNPPAFTKMKPHIDLSLEKKKSIGEIKGGLLNHPVNYVRVGAPVVNSGKGDK